MFNKKQKLKMKKNNVEVFKTYSNSKKIVKITNFNLYTNFELGLSDFTKWFVSGRKIMNKYSENKNKLASNKSGKVRFFV